MAELGGTQENAAKPMAPPSVGRFTSSVCTGLPYDAVTVSDSHSPSPTAGIDPRVLVRVYALTDVGHTRDHNEDTYLVADLERGTPVDFDGAPRELAAAAHGLLFLVADGMGGAASGELASGMAGQIVLNTLCRRAARSDRNGQQQDSPVRQGKSGASGHGHHGDARRPVR